MKASLFSVLTVCVLQTACVVGVDGGDRVTRTSQPGDFDHVALTGGFKQVQIDVCGDCEPRVKISGAENQVDDVIIVVKDGVLEVRHRSRIVITDIDLLAEIRVPSLEGVVQSGSSSVNVSSVATESFDIVSSGSGDIAVEGIVDRFEAMNSGSGDIAAYELEANGVDVTLSGSGSAQVCAKRQIRARSTGSGDVFYDCDPDTTDFDSTGSGRFSIR